MFVVDIGANEYAKKYVHRLILVKRGIYFIFIITRYLSPSDKRSHRRSSTAAENDYVANGEVELEALNGFLMKKVWTAHES